MHLFTINAVSGEIKTAGLLDTDNGVMYYDITVQASDGSNPISATFKITLADVNEFAPVFSAAIYVSISKLNPSKHCYDVFSLHMSRR